MVALGLLMASMPRYFGAMVLSGLGAPESTWLLEARFFSTCFQTCRVRLCMLLQGLYTKILRNMQSSFQIVIDHLQFVEVVRLGELQGLLCLSYYVDIVYLDHDCLL